VLPDGDGAPLEEVSNAARECGLVILLKSPKRVRAFSVLARSILQCVPLPLLVIGAASAPLSFLESAPTLRVGI
jgi:hypothetical protein